VPPLPHLPFTILSAEHHSKQPPDYYALTALIDFLTFIYVALFYQVVVSNSRSLSDFNDGKVLPLDYLLVLMTFFVLLVTERAVYTLGSHAVKTLMHLASVLTVVPIAVWLFWRHDSAASSMARAHMRLFVVLRCASALLGGLQLRAGYPPLSSFGPSGGRHAFIFYRKTDFWHLAAFNVFAAVPFLYELRTLLDWTCTSTTLDWYSWLKVEDVRSSLFIASVRRRMQADRRLGERVPRYVKFLSGVVLLGLLVLVLWLPLLVFSTGAPTYQTPTVMDVHVSITLSQVITGGDVDSVTSFVLYTGGSRRTLQT